MSETKVGRSAADAAPGHSAEPEPISVVSAVPASGPNADEKSAKCDWCEGYYSTVTREGDALLCSMCASPPPALVQRFNTSQIEERLAEIDKRFLEPLIKKASDNFYCQVLDAVDDYLLENLDHNMSSHIRMLERENDRMRTELWDVDRALGCLSMGHQTRLNAIKEMNGVMKRIRPYLTREEFDELWAKFQRDKRKRATQ